jgi:predicted CoA-binding protein
MNEPETIARILKESKVIAVVGLSDNPERPSYGVADYLMGHGYKIIPVNPGITEWKGLRSYPDLGSVPEKIDVVDIFRRSEFVMGIVKDAIAIRAKAVWMQEGVIDEKAAKLAEKSGLLVVMDRCMMKEHRKLSG